MTPGARVGAALAEYPAMLGPRTLALLAPAVIGCTAAPGQESRGWTGGGGKADSASEWSSEVGLPDRMTSTILPYWREHARAGTFAGTDGTTIRYVTLAHEHEIGALVIASGRTESYLKYAELAYDLRDVGVSIYVLDHRGQGFSDRMLDDPQKGYVYNFSDYVDDFTTFMDSVVLADAHEHVFALAHSMGGAILATYLEQSPGIIDKAVLSSPMLEINSGWLSEDAAWVAAEAATAIGLGAHYALGKGPYDPNAANDVSHSSVRYGINEGFDAQYPQIILGGPTYRWVEQAIEGERSARGDAASGIDTPILMLQAGADQVVLPGGQNTFCGHAPNCRAQQIAGAGHEILQETDELRDTALDAISTFFAD
jgi:lysophospholipase